MYGHSFHLCNLVNEKWLQIRNISVSIRVDGSSASGTERKLEPAAAGTSDDSYDSSHLYGSLQDYFQKKEKSKQNELYSLLQVVQYFRSHVYLCIFCRNSRAQFRDIS